MDAYQSQIAAATRKALDAGARVLEIFQFSADESEHIRTLLGYFDPPAHARVLDVGCGVGAVSLGMHRLRPDLSFELLNTNAWQLEQCPSEFPHHLADLHASGLQDGSFEALLVAYSIGYARLADAAKEFHRLLVDGGELFIWDMEGPAAALQMLEYHTYEPEVFQAVFEQAGFRILMHRCVEADTSSFTRLLSQESSLLQAYIQVALTQMKPVLWKFMK